MKITGKFFATLRINRDKQIFMEVPTETTIDDVLLSLKVSKDEATILLVNGRAKTAEHVLQDGDIISLFPPVGGG